MKSQFDLEGSLSAWFQADAGTAAPDYLDEIVDRVARAQQRAWWSSPERWLPMDLTARANTLAAPQLSRLILIGLLIIAAALATVIAIGSQRHRALLPFGPAANGVILSEGADGDIYVSAADGTDTRPLITDPGDDLGPSFTHDGKRFVFLRGTSQIDHHVMVANADGSGVREVTDEALMYVGSFEPSPRDDRLAVVHRFDGKRILSILDLGTGRLNHLDAGGLNVDDNALWLPPEGEELIFTARSVFNSSRGAGLYAIKPDGSGFRQIRPVRSEEWAYLDPRISQDGSLLTYWMYETDDSADHWGAHVHIVDLATGGDTRMEFDPANEDESELRFTADGRTGAIVASDGTDAFVQLVDLAGSAPPRRVGPVFAGNEPKAFEFSPDGKQLIFVFDNDEPMFVDVATGLVTTGPTKWNMYSSWQRLAP